MPEYYNAEPYKSVFDSKFYVPAGSLSSVTSVETANQLAEVNARLNAGVYGVDLALIDPRVINLIPKQHFEEIRRLAKLSNASASIHGPIMDLAGFAENKYDERQRKQAELQMSDLLEKAHTLNPEGNTPVNFHINTQMVGEARRKLSKDEIAELKNPEIFEQLTSREKEAVNRGEMIEVLGVVNQETGEATMLKHEIKETTHGKHVYSPYESLRSHNQTQWDQDKLRIFELEKRKDEVKRWLGAEYENKEFQALIEAHNKERLPKEEESDFEKKMGKINLLQQHINEIDSNLGSALQSLYHRVSKFGTEEHKEEIKTFQGNIDFLKSEASQFRKEEKKLITAFEEAAGNDRKRKEIKKAFNELRARSGLNRETEINATTSFLSHLPPPPVWISSNDFALGKTAETMANVALDSFKKFGKNTPMLTLENYQQDLTLGNAEDMRNTIETTRKLFADKLAKEKNLPKKEAAAIAEKLIGVTWDVGHINMLRRKGYTEEEILAQTKTIAPYVKQVHIADNFGFTDAHLMPGMGNSPIAQQLDILKKANFKFERGRLIVEGGEFVQQFKESPHMYALSAFHSPLYSLNADKSWYQTWNTQGAYGSGLGNIYPQTHMELYGTSFASLPRELGGQFPGEKSRFSETPTA